MSLTREIIILANSAKKGGHCVAGKDIKTGEWIRPVSTVSGGELSRKQISMGSFSHASSLDKTIINFKSHVPLPNQPENHLIDLSAWRENGKFDRAGLDHYLDTPEHIWMYGNKSDCVDGNIFESGLVANHQSLYLIRVKSIKYSVVQNYSGQQRIKGTFTYREVSYTFSVTDLAYCKYKNGPLGHTFIEYDKYLCLSLGEKFEVTGYCYKLIASVL
jgi:hypothetical protein